MFCVLSWQISTLLSILKILFRVVSMLGEISELGFVHTLGCCGHTMYSLSELKLKFLNRCRWRTTSSVDLTSVATAIRRVLE